MPDWSALNALSPPDAAAEMVDVLADLSRRLTDDPRLPEHLTEVLVRELGAPIDNETSSRLYESLTMLFGDEDPGMLIHWLSQPDQAGRLEAVAAHADATVQRFLRDVVALYGPKLAEAFRRFRESPDDWDGLHREIYHDVIQNKFRLDVQITKFSGESLLLTCDPNSLLTLTSSMMKTLNFVASAQPFSDVRIEEFRNEVDAFWQALALSSSAAPAPLAAGTITPEPATITREPATITPEPATITPEPATITPEPATITPEGATITPEPATITPEAATVPPEPAAGLPAETA